ncbi:MULTISPECIES: hypothetical protein [Anaerolinea]|uniref:hypothetical protein n=1 Tax=Anaerolinea TaxID=233189 RepID=UPI00261D924E|nr:hypothetical protein [Anaerolinea thermophila]
MFGSLNVPLRGKSEEFIRLYHHTVQEVFRYFLARCGDWQEAQELTRFVFLQAARAWSHRKDSKTSHQEWLFQIAVATLKRHPAYEPPPENGLSLPTQQQLTFFARIQEHAEQWKQLPRKYADGLAMALFTSLEVDQIAAVLGWQPIDTQANLSRLISQYTHLRTLQDLLMPVGYFTQHLEQEIRSILAQKPSNEFLFTFRLFFWRVEYLHEKIFGFLSRALPIILFVIILFWTILRLSGPSGAFSPFSPASTPIFMNEVTPTVEPEKSTIPPAGSSEDRVLYVGWDGSIRILDLATETETVLTESGFFQPSEEFTLTPPVLSPDGNWLVVNCPQDQTLWLVATDGSKTTIPIASSPVPLSWSKDGKHLFLAGIDAPRTISDYSIERGNTVPFARLPGKVLSISLSPNDKWMAVLYLSPSGLPSGEVYLGLLDRSGTKRIVLTSKNETKSNSLPVMGDYRLLWTTRSDQLWVPRWKLAYSIDDTLLAELEPSESEIPVGKYVSSREMPLWSPPTFHEEQTLTTMLALFGSSYLNKAPVISHQNERIFLSPDHYRVLISRTVREDLKEGFLILKDTTDWENNLWTTEFPSIQKADWTAEQNLLLLGETFHTPGRIWKLPVEDPQQVEVLVNDGILLGTFSSIQSQSQNLAPAFPVETIFASNPVRIPAPGVPLGSFLVPFGWQIWIYDTPTPTLSITNFYRSGPVGWIALDSSKVLINIRYSEFLISSLIQSPPADFQTVSGIPVYHLTTFKDTDQTVLSDTYWIHLKEEGKALSIDYLPSNTQQKAWVEKIILSFQIEKSPQSP